MVGKCKCKGYSCLVTCNCTNFRRLFILDRSVATKMLRTISREGQQRGPASNPSATKRRSSGRIQSARLSEDKVVKGMYNELSKYADSLTVFKIVYIVLFQSIIIRS